MRSGRTVYLLAGLALWVSACAGADAEAAIPTVPPSLTSTTSATSASPTLAPLTPTDPSRLPASEAAAVDALAAVASQVFPPDGHAHGHGATGQVDSHALTAAQQSEFDRQWQTAVAAVPALDSAEEAAAAGYTQASFTAPGVGVHWVKWSLIDRPFDPAAPVDVAVRSPLRPACARRLLVLVASRRRAHRVRRPERHVAPSLRTLRRERLGRSGGCPQLELSARAATSAAAICGCCTRGWSRSGRTGGASSRRRTRCCALPSQAPPTCPAARTRVRRAELRA